LNEMLISDTLWVNEGWQCTWPNVVCIDGSVVDLFISSAELGDQLSGTITTEIGLLKNLSIFDMSSNALTGSIPSEIGEMTSIEYFQVENNILNGTIPSQLGQMTDMVYLTLYSNKLTGTIPSTLGQLNLLVDLDLSNNSLTGSVPAEIVDKIPSYNDFNVYGNQLSNLTPIDGQVICTTTTDTTNNSSLTGEHYCNCQSHCLKELNEGYGKLCQCEEAQDCCESYFVNNNITNCVMCEEGFKNPDKLVADWELPCGLAAGFAYEMLDQYGTEEQCNDAKVEYHKQGCICRGYVPPEEAMKLNNTS